MNQVEMVCRSCGAISRHLARIRKAKLLCSCGGRDLVTLQTLVRAAGISRRNTPDLRMLPPARRLELLNDYDATKAEQEAARDRETRVEVRDGREFVVTVIPEEKPYEKRRADTRFHYSDVGKQGNGVGQSGRKRGKR